MLISVSVLLVGVVRACGMVSSEMSCLHERVVALRTSSSFSRHLLSCQRALFGPFSPSRLEVVEAFFAQNFAEIELLLELSMRGKWPLVARPHRVIVV